MTENSVEVFHTGPIRETTNVAAEYPRITGSMRQAIEGFTKNVVPGS